MNIKTTLGKIIGTTTKIGPVMIKSSGLGNSKSTKIKITDPNTGKKIAKIRISNI